MEICDIINNYNEEKLYNIIDVKEKFKEYFGMSFDELENYFSNYNLIAKEEILKYLKMEYNGCLNLEEIINNRMMEYDYYNKVLKILSFKGSAYLMLIRYLSDCKERDKSKEKLLEEVQIYHYSSIVTGKDAIRILIVLFHLIKQFNNTLENVNQKQNFLPQRLSSGSLMFETEELYPSEKLIMIDEYYLDKTSLKARKLMR